jgi:hypothetical protein
MRLHQNIKVEQFSLRILPQRKDHAQGRIVHPLCSGSRRRRSSQTSNPDARLNRQVLLRSAARLSQELSSSEVTAPGCLPPKEGSL